MISLQPVAGECHNPLTGLGPRDMQPVPVGVPLADLAPKPLGLLLCRVNGEWLPPEQWASPTRPGDVIEWHHLPQDREALRSVLQIAAVVAVNYFFPGSGFLNVAARIAGTLAANAAINAVLPLQQNVPGQPGSTGDALGTSLSGNLATLDAPIPKTCGFDLINPRFAGQPYIQYEPQLGAVDEELDRDQYFYAVYCVGIGKHDVVPMIGNTPMSAYDDLEWEYLLPGEAPTLALANVVTAPEVSGLELDSGRYSTAVMGCKPGRTAAAIGIDITAPRGLGKTSALTVEWQVQARPMNDFGQPIGAWVTIATESRSAFTNTPQRWSNKYTITTPYRPQVRVVRTDVKDTDATALHELQWDGLRVYTAQAAELHPDAAHFALRARATGQLSGIVERDVRLWLRSKARIRSGGAWQPATFTRNGAWWILDLATSNSGAWGGNLTDEYIDLESFDTIGAQANERQDRFDYTFDSTMPFWQAAQMIAKTMRCRVFRRPNGMLSITRDEWPEAAVTAFSPRNCLPGSMRLDWRLRDSLSHDAVIVRYRDHRTREWTPITCWVPGVAHDPGDEPSNPVFVDLPGVIGATHAEREGLFMAADLLYRPRNAAWKTEMQGLLLADGSPVKWQSDIVGYGATGDVVDWDGDTLVMTLSEPAPPESGTLYLTLIRDDGSVTTPVAVTRGAYAQQIVLPAAPDFTLVLDDGTRERPKFLLGTLAAGPRMVQVRAIADGGQTEKGAQLFEVSGIIDDERVHTADNDLLPGEGEIQDPIGTPDEDDEGSETVLLVNLTNQLVQSIFAGIDNVATYRLKDNGSAEKDISITGATAIASQWLKFGPWTDAETGLYECRFEHVSGAAPTSGTLNTWMTLDTSRAVTLDSATATGDTSVIRVRIRLASTGVQQDSAQITLQAFSDGGGGG